MSNSFRDCSKFRSRNTERRQKRSDDDTDWSIATGNVPKYWRTTPSGVRIVDDTVGSGEEWSGEMGMVARVRCQTKIIQSSSSHGQQERVVFWESSTNDGSVVLSKDGCGVTLLVVGTGNPGPKNNHDHNNNGTTTTMTKGACLEYSALQESLIGMRVGGLRRVLIPTTATENNAFKVRFVGPGSATLTEETIIMNLQLENLESPSSLNYIVATTLTSGGPPAALLLLFRPFLLVSPLGLLSFISFAPLLIKKVINGIAALELYMDVNADTIYPIKTLLEWKLKF